MGLVAVASLITAFLAGVAALFAPCCVGVLLPSYLASIFKSRTKIFLMTFMYYLGLLTIFLPLGLGFSSLGGLFRDFHTPLFIVGGAFMLILGLTMVLGKSFMLPIHVDPTIKKQHGLAAFYVLGIFSGIATSCCAPVLAGVMALSFLPGSIFAGAAYSLAFVTGMVVPLFIVALAVDRTKVMDKLTVLRKRVSYKLFGHEISVFLSHLVSGILYILVGAVILLFESSGPEAFANSYQININLITASVTQTVTEATKSVPDFVWAILLVGLFAAIAILAYKQSKTEPNKDKED
jgi:cytochrome c biogenesis protein CcdA